jgi:hypothetical protein
MAKSKFAAVVAPTLAPSTVAVSAIDPNTPVNLTYGQLQELLASAAKPASKNRKTAPAVVPVAPVSTAKAEPTPKPERRTTGVSFFSTGKVCMLNCVDGNFGSTKTTPPVGEQFPVLFLERATMKDGVAVVLPEETRIYSAKEWKRNSKNTGWIALFPRRITK